MFSLFNATKSMSDFAAQLELACEHLSKHDTQLRTIIQQAGPCKLRPSRKYFGDLISSIIGQQLSGKAAQSILSKVKALYDGKLPEAQALFDTPDEHLRAAGVSPQKLGYLKDLCEHVLAGKLKLSSVSKLGDAEIVGALTAVKGIGEWTAHMFLMFSLGRLDVLAVGDLGVRKGMQKVYRLFELPKPDEMIALAESKYWSPYRSVACWYMWRAIE